MGKISQYAKDVLIHCMLLDRSMTSNKDSVIYIKLVSSSYGFVNRLEDQGVESTRWQVCVAGSRIR